MPNYAIWILATDIDDDDVSGGALSLHWATYEVQHWEMYSGYRLGRR
jgi:hypothetical protein